MRQKWGVLGIQSFLFERVKRSLGSSGSYERVRGAARKEEGKSLLFL